MQKEAKHRRIRVGVIIAIFLAFVVWWALEFHYTSHGYQTVALKPGETTFTAPFEHMFFVSVCNDDVSLKEELDAEPAQLSVELLDAEGKIIYQAKLDVTVHTNGFTNTDSISMPDLPVTLEPGQEYSLLVTCVSAKGTPVTDLQVLVYGDAEDTQALTLFWFILGAALLALLVWYAGQDAAPLPAFALMLMMASLLTIFYLPARQDEPSRTSFANVYAASSRLLGREGTDEQGFAYIEEDAIRNDGYADFGDPYWRFFYDAPEREYARTFGLSSTQYRTDSSALNPMQIPAVLATALCRSFSAPYQLIRLIGSIVNAVICLILILIAYHLLEEPALKWFLLLFSLLPSVTLSFAGESGFGIFIGLCCLTLALWNRRRQHRGYLAAGLIALVYPVWCLLRLSGYPLRDGLHMLLTGYDSLLMESIAGDGRFTKTAVFTGLAFLLIFLFKASADRKMGNRHSIFAIWLVPLSAGLLLTDGLLYSSLSVVQGTVLLPLYLLPCRWRGDGSFIEDHRALLTGVCAYCIAVIYLTRFAVL